MHKNRAVHGSIGIIIILALGLSACAPAATPTAAPPTQLLAGAETSTAEPATEPTDTPTPEPTAVPPTEPPPPSATPEPTATAEPTATPPPTSTPPPPPTPDPEVARYLKGVESVLLQHSPRLVPERSLGVGHACDERYFIAFPYIPPDRRGGMSFMVAALEREPDGTVREGEHIRIWHLGDEGLYIDRWHRISLTDRSVKGLLTIQFLLEEPDGGAWQVGVASAPCPGDDLRMVGFFPLSHPEDYTLLFTRYDAQAPLDFWLQDGDQLRRYNWEPWTGTLLWTLEEIPGRLMAVEWGEDSPDLTGDGIPDLVIHWDVSGETVPWVYAADGPAFIPVGAADPG